jgi:hypothetical protein
MVRFSEPEERCFIDAYFRKLPPTLHKRNRLPIPSCSKAPRGLFVQQRVPGIFTGSSISPSPWLRECSDRYAFRAGRNLPDKGLRYHRTVIVTAAVHPGLNQKLTTQGGSPPVLTYGHWASVGPYTSHYWFSRSLCFC